MILAACRFLVGGVLLVSAVTKLRDVGAFAGAARNFGVPSRWVRPVAMILPPLEFACGLCLVVGVVLVPAGILTAGLLLAFTLGISVNLRRGRRVSCACFGASSATPLSGLSVLRNLGLVGAAAVVAGLGHLPRSGVIDRLDLVTAGLVIALLVVAAWQLAVNALALARVLRSATGPVV